MWVSSRILFRILGGALAGWHLLFLWWVVQSVPGAPLLRRWWGRAGPASPLPTGPPVSLPRPTSLPPHHSVGPAFGSYRHPSKTSPEWCFGVWRNSLQSDQTETSFLHTDRCVENTTPAEKIACDCPSSMTRSSLGPGPNPRPIWTYQFSPRGFRVHSLR